MNPQLTASLLSEPRSSDKSQGDGEVIELECGITIYPARSKTGRWRAVWYEAGVREQCEAATQEKLAPKRRR